MKQKYLINSVFIAFTLNLISFPPLIAREKNWNHLILALDSNNTNALVTGKTGGAYSLASIANLDRYGNPCIGYGSPEPDYTLTLKNDFPSLSIVVDSGGKDTTLLIQGSNKKNIRCSFGLNNNRDAILKDKNWKADTYKIWVGSISPNQRSHYRLSIDK